MHAFDSVVTESEESLQLAAQGDSKYKSKAVVRLSDFSCTNHPTENYGVKTYTPRTLPVQFSEEMSATVSQYIEVDIVPENTRLGRMELHDKQSKLIWEMEKRTRKAGTPEPFTNLDGTQGTTTLPADVH